MNKWYEIRAAGNSRTAEVYIFGDIGESWWSDQTVTARQFVNDLDKLDAEILNVRINSYGGAVSDGLAIYNALRRHRAKKTATVEGVAVSIASLIAMAGDTVDMPANSLLMIHAPWGAVQGNAADMRDMADVLDRYAAAMASSYARKTGQPEADMLALLTDGENHWYTAVEAQAAGFADTVSAELKAAASIPPRFRPQSTPIGVAAMADDIKPTPPAAPVSAAPAPVAPAAAPAQPDNVIDIRDAAKREALAAEKTRRQDIRSLLVGVHAKNPALQEVMNACLDDPDCTREMASQRLLRKLGESAEPLHGAMSVTADGRDRFKAGLGAALAARAGLANDDPGNEFRGYTLIEMARASLMHAGVSSIPGNKMGLVAAAITHTTSDFPYLLADTAEKAMLKGYSEAEETFATWTRAGRLTDFKAASRTGMSEFSDLDEVKEGAEFKHGTVGERREQIQLATYGKLFSISRQAIINDDLGAFSDIPRKMGRAAPRKVGDLVYAVLTGNPNMADGTALFHANHSNLAGSAAALSLSTVGAGRTAMGRQTDSSGAANALNIRPRYLIVPITLEDAAGILLNSEYDPDTANKLQRYNPARGWNLTLVSDARLDASSTTAYFLAADQNVFDTVEVAYLDGNPNPYLEQQNGWTVDGVEFKVRLDAAVKALDWRTMYKNAGA